MPESIFHEIVRRSKFLLKQRGIAPGDYRACRYAVRIGDCLLTWDMGEIHAHLGGKCVFGTTAPPDEVTEDWAHLLRFLRATMVLDELANA